MSEEKKYHNYTVLDIEKYQKGLLSAKEMHELERAALDDPFLADALEGYGSVAVDASADLLELEKKLEERVSEAKVIPITKRRGGFVWWRAAVAIVFIAGAGLFLYKFAFQKSNKEVAKFDEKKVQQNIPSTPIIDSAKKITPGIGTNDAAVNNKNKTAGNANKNESLPVNADNSGSGKTSDTIISVGDAQALSEISVPLNKDVAKNDADIKIKQAEKPGVKNDDKKEVPAYNDLAIQKKYKSAQDTTAQAFFKANAPLTGKVLQTPTNYFRGRIVDSNNIPLPFANITNTRDNVGTYADARGYFTLISPDSVLNVQVYSNGYAQNNNVQLRNNILNNQVIMQEDRSLQGLVLSKKPFNTNRSREANMKFEEPEPADGWFNYDTYLVNNIKMPEDLKTKRTTGAVQISFDVNPNGDPTNIKVEKSLCQKCDEEAIRLIKEGPKWKRKGKKSRVTVTVPFDL